MLADYFDVTTDYLLGRTDYRYTSRKMDQRLSREYTLSEVVDTVLGCNAASIGHLMEYAGFLQYKQDQENQTAAKGRPAP